MTTFDWNELGALIVGSDPMPKEYGIAGGGFAGSTESNWLKFLVKAFFALPVDRQGRASIRVGGHSYGPDDIRQLAQREDFPFK